MMSYMDGGRVPATTLMGLVRFRCTLKHTEWKEVNQMQWNPQSACDLTDFCQVSNKSI
jgi:hypothetical protein